MVSTSIGNEGLNLEHGVDALIADDPIEFANRTVELYTNAKMWTTLSKNSITFVKNNFSKNNAKHVMLEALGIIREKHSVCGNKINFPPVDSVDKFPARTGNETEQGKGIQQAVAKCIWNQPYKSQSASKEKKVAFDDETIDYTLHPFLYAHSVANTLSGDRACDMFIKHPPYDGVIHKLIVSSHDPVRYATLALAIDKIQRTDHGELWGNWCLARRHEQNNPSLCS